MHRARRQPLDARIEITPLIDVVFLLLTFFVFALVLTLRVDLMDIALPEAGAGEPSEPGQPIVLLLDASGQTFLEGRPVGENIGAAVQAALESRPEAIVTIAADTAADWGSVQGLVAALRAAGVRDFRFLTPAGAGGEAGP